MLELVATHLRAQGGVKAKQGKRIWVDVGGGTGWNIEQMAKIDPESFFSFDAIYLSVVSDSRLMGFADLQHHRAGST